MSSAQTHHSVCLQNMLAVEYVGVIRRVRFAYLPQHSFTCWTHEKTVPRFHNIIILTLRVHFNAIRKAVYNGGVSRKSVESPLENIFKTMLGSTDVNFSETGDQAVK